MLEPINVDVCARKGLRGLPDRGARDQYMPLAGAGDTSGAVFGSGRGGNVLWPSCIRRAGGTAIRGFGEGISGVLCLDFGTIADVDRMFKGLRSVSLGGDVTGGDAIDSVPSLGVLPLLCIEGGLDEDVRGEGVFWDSF